MSCKHTWSLHETGYSRGWHTEIDETTQTIRAYFGGSEDFSEEGAGDDHLVCLTCLATKPIPQGWEVEYL